MANVYDRKRRPRIQEDSMNCVTHLKIIGLAIFLCSILQTGHAEPVPIRLGTTTALSGPAKALGQAMVKGMLAYFTEVNAAGGIFGRKIEFVALDDGYHPNSARRQMQALIDDHEVLAVVGNVGTPTAEVTVPMSVRHNVPLIGAFTGAKLLRKRPPDHYIVNFRASYEEEMASIIEALLVQGIHAEQIAFFTQDDSYGDAGYQGAIKALKTYGFTHTDKLIHGRYPRNTLNVEEALVEIVTAKHAPLAVVIVGTYGPAARFIRQAHKMLPDTLFFNISFVGADALAQELNGCCENVYVSQVVPPLNDNLPAIAAYRQALVQSDGDGGGDYVSFEGYLVGSIVVEAIRRAGPGVNRELLIDAIETCQDLDIGIGVGISFSEAEHQGSHHVWLTRIEGERVVASDWESLN